MRDSFIFYKSFYEAISYLDEKDQGEVYKAVIEYALEGKEPQLEGAAMGMFLSFKPQIDANNKRYMNGQKGAEYGKLGGRPKKKKGTGDNNKNPIGVLKNNPTGVLKNETKKTPNENVNENENVNDNANANQNENDINNPHTPLQGEKAAPKKSASEIVAERDFSEKLKAHVINWIDYKREKRQAYKETGLRSFLTQVENNVSEYGEDAVIGVIDSSMAANYQGVVWEKIKSPPKRKVMDWGSLR